MRQDKRFGLHDAISSIQKLREKVLPQRALTVNPSGGQENRAGERVPASMAVPVLRLSWPLDLFMRLYYYRETRVSCQEESIKKMKNAGRANQKLRTRAALLEAAAALIDGGRNPTVAEAAKAALISRATAYRYFTTQEDLLNEAVLHVSMASADKPIRKAFRRTTDPEKRADLTEQGIHDVVYDHEFQMRLLLRASLDKWFSGSRSSTSVPRRQARRKEWFGEAIAPVRKELGEKNSELLTNALALLTGIESLIVLGDVLRLDRKQARSVKSWAVQALVREALRQSSAKSRARRRKLR
jgi:AcrR family transcriptional regulator